MSNALWNMAYAHLQAENATLKAKVESLEEKKMEQNQVDAAQKNLFVVDLDELREGLIGLVESIRTNDPNWSNGLIDLFIQTTVAIKNRSEVQA